MSGTVADAGRLTEGFAGRDRDARPGLRRARAAATEDSVRLRGIVLAMVLVGTVALIAQGAVDPLTAVASLVLIPVGSWFSYRRRRKRNLLVKAVLAVALLAVLGSFIARVRSATSVDDARASLASLFLWVQVLHGFDLPRRRDLAFSVLASFLLVAEAGTLSLGSGLAIFLVPYVGLAGAWLYESHRLQAEEAAPSQATIRIGGSGSKRARSPLQRARWASGSAVALMLAIGLVFLAIPRLPGTVVVAPPFSLSRAVAVPGFSGGVVNPGLPARLGGSPVPFSAAAYPGYGEEVDLRGRGHLSDRVVLKVRSSQPAFWRAQVYDRFDGTRWTASDTSTVPLQGGEGAPASIPRAPETAPAIPTREVVQTFYVQEQQPNVVFGAYEPRQVYFPAPGLRVDRYGSIRSPILLESGMVYSVVSEVPVASPGLLRASPARWPADVLGRYTQLPADLPVRVARLAHRIADPASTVYDKVIAVQDWLRANTRYNLDIPPDPPGVDAVDYFLFDRRQGFCEHIASAMAILLRSVGIPARFAVGYDTGGRNLLSGYWEVRQSDAHSWVEVDYPGVGWIQYDPTHQVPLAAPGLGSRFIAPQVVAAVARFLGAIVPGAVKRLAGTVASAVARGARGLVLAWPAVVVLAAAAGAAVLLRRARKRRERPPDGAAAAFVSLCRTYERRGISRPPSRTPREHLRRLLAEADLTSAARGDVELIVRTFERARFSGRAPSPGEVDGSLEAAARVRTRRDRTAGSW